MSTLIETGTPHFRSIVSESRLRRIVVEQANPCTTCPYQTPCATTWDSKGPYACTDQLGYTMAQNLLNGQAIEPEKANLREFLAAIEAKLVDPTGAWTPKPLSANDIPGAVDRAAARANAFVYAMNERLRG